MDQARGRPGAIHLSLSDSGTYLDQWSGRLEQMEVRPLRHLSFSMSSTYLDAFDEPMIIFREMVSTGLPNSHNYHVNQGAQSITVCSRTKRVLETLSTNSRSEPSVRAYDILMYDYDRP